MTTSQLTSSRTAAIPRPLQGRYGVTLAAAILALAPFIVVTTAYELFRNQLARDIHADQTGIELIAGLATAGYAFGALLGGDFIQRFAQRKLFLICEGLFVAASVLCATAVSAVQYGAGSVLQGLATGLLLVIALPPVIRRFPPEKLPITAALVNLGFFGAVTAGPLLGGAAAAGHAWRWFYGALAAIGLLVEAAALLTLPDQPPPNPAAPLDRAAVLLALAATVLPFWGANELPGYPFPSYRFTVPVAIGCAAFVALLLVEYHKREPLSPVKPMWHTLPVVGTIVAMMGGGVYVSFLLLTEVFESKVERLTPLATGISFWPQVLGVVIAAGMLGLLLRTRWLPLLPLAGMLLLVGGGVILLGLAPHQSRATILAANGVLGLGAGATVAPGLWMAGFSLPSKMVGRTFALVELVRSEADFILAPVILQVARSLSASPRLNLRGIHEAVWITILITLSATALCCLLYLAGGAGLPAADLEAWLHKDRPGINSPALAAALLHRQ